MSQEPSKLSDQEINALLGELDGWSIKEGMLHKTFEFGDFNEAFGWMARVALEAEKMDHHPDWCNSWNKVHVHLMTHSIDALSELDREMARTMESIAGS